MIWAGTWREFGNVKVCTHVWKHLGIRILPLSIDRPLNAAVIRDSSMSDSRWERCRRLILVVSGSTVLRRICLANGRSKSDERRITHGAVHDQNIGHRVYDLPSSQGVIGARLQSTYRMRIRHYMVSLERKVSAFQFTSTLKR